MATLRHGSTVVHVDLEKCEEADPCAYDNTCRMHKLRWFLRYADLIVPNPAEREQLEIERRVRAYEESRGDGPEWEMARAFAERLNEVRKGVDDGDESRLWKT